MKPSRRGQGEVDDSMEVGLIDSTQKIRKLFTRGSDQRLCIDNLKENVADLMKRLRSKRYKAHPVRRAYIPKPGKSEKRPLGVPTVEDKLVQTVVKEILEDMNKTSSSVRMALDLEEAAIQRLSR